MSYERPAIDPGGIYHVFNRGVAKQAVYHDNHDYRHFLETLGFYLEQDPALRFSRTTAADRRAILRQEPQVALVEILAYSLMPNHFHLVIRQLAERGVAIYMQRTLNSYTKAYNAKYRRVGPVFQGAYRVVTIDTDEQLLHVSRYVHLNGFVAKLVSTPADHRWCSLPDYLANRSHRICHPSTILQLAGSTNRYREFVEDYGSYASDLAVIKHQLLDLIE